MDFITIPTIGFNLAFIIVTICLTEFVKKFCKWKPIYPLLPVIFGLVLGFLQGLIENGINFKLIEIFFKNSFVIIGGAISSYDIVVKKVKEYVSKSKGENV